jgi:trigger factor
MGAPVSTTVTELPDSRVRVDVQVAPEEVEARVQRKAGELGRELKLPGFRKGKVPAPLVLQRVGREAVLDEAVRDSLGGWYAEAIRASEIVPVGDPKIELGPLPGRGNALEFSIEIGVLPAAELGEYRGLEVGRREPVLDEELVEREIETMRERLARLQTAQRPAGEGDYVVVDYVGRLPVVGEEVGEGSEPGATTLVPFEGGEGRDQLIELGGSNLIPGFEEGLLGARAGETRTVGVSFPDDYPNQELAGREASFQIAVKEVKGKLLPDVDEDFAVDAGFDDVDELREDIGRRLLGADEQRIEQEFREAALDAAVAGARVSVTEELARSRAEEMWERMLHSLSHRGISREAYLQIVGRGEDEMLAEMAPDAERALRREAVLTAIVAAEEIEPSEEDLLEALTPTAEREGIPPEQVLARLRDAGRLEELREDLAARQAIELIVEQAKPIPVERAIAREKLWTPEKEAESEREQAGAGVGEGGSPGGLWTPGR